MTGRRRQRSRSGAAGDRFRTAPDVGSTRGTRSRSARTTTRPTSSTALLIAHNDERLARRRRLRPAPASRHRDRDLGAVGHAWSIEDSAGHHGVVSAGRRAAAERRHRGRHSERADVDRRPSTSCRCGCRPDERGPAPAYDQLDVDAVALGRRAGARRLGPGPARIERPRSDCATGGPALLGRPGSAPATSSSCPMRRFVHLFVARGAVERRERRAARTPATPCGCAEAGPRRDHGHREPAELLVWEMLGRRRSTESGVSTMEPNRGCATNR